jgi:phosphopantetheine adenylyltransferase
MKLHGSLPLLMNTFARIEYTFERHGIIIEFIRKCCEELVAKKDATLTLLVSVPSIGFQSLQLLLKALYEPVVRVGWENNNPLINVDVIIENMCGYQYDTKPDLEFVLDRRVFKCPFRSWEFSEAESRSAPVEESEEGKYPVVVLGGTFDYLHCGHKILLTMAAYLASQKVICGVSDLIGERLTKKKYFEVMQSLSLRLMQSLSLRLKQVIVFLQRIKRDIELQVVPIDDDYGPTKSEPRIDCIVGSLETKRGCEMGILG